ncbi:MAG: sugar phosphate isomerase/epimerase [Emcibacteraceae bacterium]|nr:sugar phosphate isomerase/epimerase [Emcibacteraceae bacterium]
MNRRNFLATTAAFSAASMMNFGGVLNASAAPIKNIGIQLYTIREMMETDFEGSIAKVAEIGYKEVEFFNYFGRNAKDVKNIIDQNGLSSPSIHVDIDQLRGDALFKEIEYATTLDQKYITLAWLGEENRKTFDQYKAHAEVFQRAGEECNKAGLKFVYHNHEFEFIDFDGVRPYDMLLEQLSQDIMLMEMDFFWMAVAGEDPLAYFAKYPGRFPMCHIKDRAANGDMVYVGDGEIDFNSILAKASQAGIKHFFVEHDTPQNQMAMMQRSFESTKKFQIR